MPKPKPNPQAEFARAALAELIDMKFYKGDGQPESVVIWLKAHAIKRLQELSMMMGIEGSALRRCGMDRLGQPKTGKQFKRQMRKIGE